MTGSEEHTSIEDQSDARSDTFSDVSSLLSKRRQRDAPLLRNAMGEYLSPDGKPLTQVAIPLPGPADYSPACSLTKRSAPQYSIVGKPKNINVNSFPGPNMYTTEGDMVWRDRGFPLIGKGKVIKHETCTNGPAGYLLEYENFGSGNSKWTMSGRPQIITGPPNRSVQPSDTHGFSTPGPAEYRPNSGLWKKNIKKSIGLRLNEELCKNNPGPGEYDINANKSGPAYSLAKRLPLHIFNDNPGPGAYNISTTIGTAVAKSMSSRQADLSNQSFPSPNTYSVPSRIGEAPKHSMTYREFERKSSPKPSPANYRPNVNNLEKRPQFSCRKVCRPIYPDILNYAEHSLMKNEKVGPGTYLPEKDFAKNDAPSYSMGKRMKTSKNETPGPATYHIKQTTRPDAKRAAAFSMGIRIKTKSETVGPGPAAYYPKETSSTPQYSMSGRHKITKSSETPAPNAYAVKQAQTNYGTFKGSKPTLKGRPSPYVYSGLKKVAA